MANTINDGTSVTAGSDGVLLTLADAKAYLRVSGTTEDGVISDLIHDAEAYAEGYIGRLLTAAEVEETHTLGANATGIRVYNWPLDPDGTVEVTYRGLSQTTASDVSSSFAAFHATGTLKTSGIIPAGEYVVTYTGGMSLSPTWTRDAVVLSGAVRDIVAEWYANRDPGASSVGDGDVSRTTASPITGARGGVPPRVLGVLDRYRGW